MPSLQPCFSFGDLLESVHSFLGGPDAIELFDEAVGPFADEISSLSGDGPAFPIGLFRGWPVIACEAAPGCPFPDYRERRLWRGELPEPFREAIVIFTDAAHSAFMWTWRASHPGRYVEYNSATRPVQLRSAIAGLPEAGAVAATSREVDARVVERLSETIVRRRGSGPEPDRLQTILDDIEQIEDPDEVRRIWRRLRGFSVLHDDCVDGERLAAAGAVLELVMTAALERMRSFVEDAVLRRDRRRPEHLRDLRSVTDGAEDRRWCYDQTRYLRRLIVQQNLFATVSHRPAGRAVLRDLLKFAGADDTGLPVIDCNIWRWKDSAAGWRAGTSRSVAGEPGLASGAIRDEELALLRQAWEMVRAVRLAGGEFRELKVAACRLQRRRQLFLRQIRELARLEEPHPVPEALWFYRFPPDRAFSAVIDDIWPG